MPDTLKAAALRSSFPRPYDTRLSSTLSKLLSCIGLSDQDVVDQIAEGVNQIYLDKATGIYLSQQGHNVGVPRPPAAPFDDDLYRKIVMLLGYLPKATMFPFYMLMEIVFGSQESLRANNVRPWRIYVINPSEVIIEVPSDLFGASDENASYLHGIDGVGYTDPTLALAFYYVNQDITKIYPGNPNGFALNYYDAGAWQIATIKNWVWNGSFTEIEVTAPLPIDIKTKYYVTLVGDGAVSNKGDFVLNDATILADTATTPSHDVLVYLSGNGKLEIVQYYIDLLVRAACIAVRYVYV